jgi:hypothetical protein
MSQLQYVSRSGNIYAHGNAQLLVETHSSGSVEYNAYVFCNKAAV